MEAELDFEADSDALNGAVPTHAGAATFMDPALAPWVQLSQVYWMSFRVLDRRLLPCNVTASQARVLMVLHWSARPLKLTEISALLFQEAQTATAMVHRLETRGLIIRDADPSDQRALRLRLSTAGRELAVAISGIARTLYEELFLTSIRDDEAEQLVTALRKVRDRAFTLPETDFRLRAARRYSIWRE